MTSGFRIPAAFAFLECRTAEADSRGDVKLRSDDLAVELQSHDGDVVSLLFVAPKTVDFIVYSVEELR